MIEIAQNKFKCLEMMEVEEQNPQTSNPPRLSQKIETWLITYSNGI